MFKKAILAFLILTTVILSCGSTWGGTVPPQAPMPPQAPAVPASFAAQANCCGVGCKCGACGADCACAKKQIAASVVPKEEAVAAVSPAGDAATVNCNCGPQCGCPGKAGGECNCHTAQTEAPRMYRSEGRRFFVRGGGRAACST